MSVVKKFYSMPLLIEFTMGNAAEKECYYFKKEHFQADIVLPLFGFEYKETINILIRAFQAQQGEIPDDPLLSSPGIS